MIVVAAVAIAAVVVVVLLHTGELLCRFVQQGRKETNQLVAAFSLICKFLLQCSAVVAKSFCEQKKSSD